MSPAGRVFAWVLIAFLVLLSLGVGLALITEGLGGRRALDHGPVGAFTPTATDSCERTCALIGDFTSIDGTVVEHGVTLQGRRIKPFDPMPSAVDDVRLDTDAQRPTAYTADYAWHGPVIKGSAFMVGGLAVAAVLVTVLKRHDQARDRPAA